MADDRRGEMVCSPSSSDAVAALSARVREGLRDKVRWEDLTSGAGTQGDARGDVRALLDDVLDALRPGRSLAWRESAVGVGGPNAYVDVQKTAVSLVQKDFVSVLVDAESGTLQDCFFLLVDEGRALDNFIEAAQRQGKAEAPPQQEAPRYAKEFKPFAALSSLWTAAGKLVAAMVRHGMWHSSQSAQRESDLLSWFLPKLRREAAEYAGCTGSDKRRVHVLKFWFQTFNRLFCPADVTSSEGQPTPPWGDAAVRDYHAMCDETVEAMRGRPAELRSSLLAKMLPFSSFIFASGWHGALLVQLCLDGCREGGARLLLDFLSHHEGRLGRGALGALASGLPAMVASLARGREVEGPLPTPSNPLGGKEDALAVFMVQCSEHRCLWDELEASVVRVFASAASPRELSLVLGPWCEALRFASESSAAADNKAARVHLCRLLRCLALVAPNASESRRSAVVSEQLAAAVHALLERNVVRKEDLAEAITVLEAESSERYGTRLACEATKLCLLQVCGSLDSRTAPATGPMPGGPLQRATARDCQGKSSRKRMAEEDARAAVEALRGSRASKRPRAWRDHDAACAFELLMRASLEDLGPAELAQVDEEISRAASAPGLQHYAARILDGMPVDRIEGHFHGVLVSPSFLVVHLAMESLTRVCKRLHSLGRDFRHLVPQAVHNYKEGSSKVFVKCLHEHVKRLRAEPEEAGDSVSPATLDWQDEVRGHPWVCGRVVEGGGGEGAREGILRILSEAERLVRAAEDRYRRQSKPDESNRRSGDESVRSILRELKNLKDLAEK